MLSRHDISDEHWDRIRHLLPGQAGQHGGVGNDTRTFLNAIRYLAKIRHRLGRSPYLLWQV